MICYRDRSFCADQDQCATTECDRRYTARDEKANTCDLPVSMSSFKATCGKFEEKKDLSRKEGRRIRNG